MISVVSKDSIFICRWTIALSEVIRNPPTHFTHSWYFRQNFILLSLQEWNILLECSDSQGSGLSDWLMCVTLHEMSLLFLAHPSLQQPWSELVISSHNSVQHVARKRLRKLPCFNAMKSHISTFLCKLAEFWHTLWSMMATSIRDGSQFSGFTENDCKERWLYQNVVLFGWWKPCYG